MVLRSPMTGNFNYEQFAHLNDNVYLRGCLDTNLIQTVPRINTELYMAFFSNSIVNHWNTLPNEIKYIEIHVNENNYYF